MERYGSGQIKVVEYDLNWPAMFDQEREKLETVLGDLVVTIEHIGSTAVPGLAAKPIIDLLVGVRSLNEARLRCIDPLHSLGYSHITDYEAWLPSELFFRKRVPGPWTHHVHMMEPSDSRGRWDEFLLFRDYLRGHPEAVSEYAELKRSAAVTAGDDIEIYRNAKNTFVEATKAKARTERRLIHLSG
jgi:GrpB-like predicted nucleotidyltransferase (UPF0157 family)